MRSLGLDAYLVGGAVRDELLGRESKDADFLVPGVDAAGLQAALAPPRQGRGAHRRRQAGRHAPLSARPRGRARSRRPGSSSRRSGASARPDPAATTSRSSSTRPRRSPTTSAAATSRSTRWHASIADGELVDPFGGRDDLERAACSARSRRTSFAEDPLRLVRGLRFVSQLDLDPDDATLAQMRESAARVAARLGRAARRRPRRRRDGGALEAAARRGSRARRCGSCATPASSPRSCRSSRPAIGFDSRSTDHDDDASTSTRSPSFRRPPTRGRRSASGWRRSSTISARRSRLRARDHAETAARLADGGAASGSATRPSSASASSGSSASTRSCSARATPSRPGACSPRHGEGLAFDLLDHWSADLRGRDQTDTVEAKLDRLSPLPRGRRAGAARARTGSATSPSTAPT